MTSDIIITNTERYTDPINFPRPPPSRLGGSVATLLFTSTEFFICSIFNLIFHFSFFCILDSG